MSGARVGKSTSDISPHVQRNGDNPTVLNVVDGGNDGKGTLAAALSDAKALKGKPSKIVIRKGLTLQPRKEPHTVKVKNLTISGEPGSLISSNFLFFDCSASDNVILQNLTFAGTPAKKDPPRDSIEIDRNKGRGEIGFWIDHCRFEAYYDLNVTSNTPDLKGQPPLLITVSNCRFHNDNPNGKAHRNNGALGIHGSRDKKDPKSFNRSTNAYATVTRNVFDTVRRRSPRSSGLCYVHAFNNVLNKWGAKDMDDQVTGMSSGHDGRIVAEANYFFAGPLKEAFEVSVTKGMKGFLTVHEDDDRLKNVYKNGAIAGKQVGDVIDIDAAYRDRNIAVPAVTKMDDNLRKSIEDGAGPAGK
jgi:pectate lyase